VTRGCKSGLRISDGIPARSRLPRFPGLSASSFSREATEGTRQNCVWCDGYTMKDSAALSPLGSRTEESFLAPSARGRIDRHVVGSASVPLGSRGRTACRHMESSPHWWSDEKEDNAILHDPELEEHASYPPKTGCETVSSSKNEQLLIWNQRKYLLCTLLRRNIPP
jgi:hypothetical protein